MLQGSYPDKPRLVHRLDRTTSGILVLARTRKAAQDLASRFREATDSNGKDDPNAPSRIQKKVYLEKELGSHMESDSIVGSLVTALTLPLSMLVFCNCRFSRPDQGTSTEEQGGLLWWIVSAAGRYVDDHKRQDSVHTDGYK